MPPQPISIARNPRPSPSTLRVTAMAAKRNGLGRGALELLPDLEGAYGHGDEHAGSQYVDAEVRMKQQDGEWGDAGQSPERSAQTP